MQNKITAVIPVRAGSKRLPNKNILPFGDSNLLIHKIRQLKQVKGLDTIVVSSDSPEMLNMAYSESAEGDGMPKIVLHERPAEYCDDTTKPFKNIAENIEGDIILWAVCVCPLLSVQTYDKAIQTYLDLVVEKKKNLTLL